MPAAVATWTAAAALAAAVGPALGGALTGGGGTWRWIFIVNVPVGTLVVIAAARRIPRLVSLGRAPDLSLGSASEAFSTLRSALPLFW